ncbi:hypothetical protein OG500_18170 [Kitasatospora sp. NBC_01250]|uniref:hypothetical protein n=1 Tax=Kitasatospora sp. NBC_01250 TaxID=2903571 RepID=UPI002E37F9D0|nr:hypothetical protein [Kitasatospora sp. NBC_01250]
MTDDQFDRRPGPAAPPRAGRPGSEEPAGRAPTHGEEQALRVLLHRAVADLQPDAEALPRIRRAIPARRARHRQAWTGALLIALVSAAAVPTLGRLGGLQLSDGSGAAPSTAPSSVDSRSPSAAGHPGGVRPVVPLPVPDSSSTGPSSSPSPTPSPSAGAADTSGGVSASATAISVTAGQAAGTATGAPACLRADLGAGQATVGAADGAGWVYGAFTVANVSGRPCLLTDPGTLTATLGGGSTAGSVRVLAHTAGDPAGGLPDPASAPGQLLLGAGAGYRLPFAFVPDALCPAGGSGSGGAGAGATPTPSASAAAPAASPVSSPSGGPGGGPSGAAGAAAGSAANDTAGRPPASGGSTPSPGGGAGAAPAGLAADGPATGTASPTPSPAPSGTPGAPGTAAQPGTVTVTHRPLGVAPDAGSATIPNVCGGGTLYRAAPQQGQ